MDIATIVLGVGVFISLLLGVINFLWGGGILSRREKVILRESMVATSIMEEPREDDPHLNKIDRIFIRSNIKLVRTRGREDLYIEEVYLQFNQALCKKLRTYFRIPSNARIHWDYSSHFGLNEVEYRTLKINQPKFFDIYGNFGSKSSLRALEEEAHQSHTEEHQEKQRILEDIEEQVRKLESRYEVVCIDGKGKKWRYKYPQRWWNNLLPEWLWWKL